jgi:putative ABC transport system substrate-binding protein
MTIITRRQFAAALGSAAAWPIAARAQQRQRMRRIGFLIGLAPDDSEGLARVTAFSQGLQEHGWTVGRNLHMEFRSAGGLAANYRKYAEELIALAPDVILAGGGGAAAAMQQATAMLPIVFANVTDPVGAGLVTSLARPGGNITGFMNFEFSLGGKLLELLKEIAPRVTRAAVLRNAGTSSAGVGQFGAIQAVAPSFGVELTAVGARDADEIERGIKAFVRGPNDGLIVTAQLVRSLRDLVITLAARHRLPTVYPFRGFVTEGGLISFGTDQAEPYRQAASYVDRILKGEKPADLPVQAPTKYELVLNLKTAKALGIDIAATVLARADDVIE